MLTSLNLSFFSSFFVSCFTDSRSFPHKMLRLENKNKIYPDSNPTESKPKETRKFPSILTQSENGPHKFPFYFMLYFSQGSVDGGNLINQTMLVRGAGKTKNKNKEQVWPYTY